MNRKSWKQVGLVALCAMSLISSATAFAVPTAYKNVTPSFTEEFTGTALNTAKWSKTYPWGLRNNSGTGEVQYYADNAFSLSNGILNIKAEKKATQGYPYTSGIICSYGKFSQQYGYFEMRAKFPKGKGLWPAFWLLPNSLTWPPEIDIMEFLGNQPTATFMTLHYNSSTGQYGSSSNYYVGPDFTKDYHTFGVDWRPNSITWYVDDVQRYQVTKNVPAGKFYIIANLAVGGNWPGLPDSTTPFPSYMNIDYIRAYPYTGQ